MNQNQNPSQKKGIEAGEEEEEEEEEEVVVVVKKSASNNRVARKWTRRTWRAGDGDTALVSN